MTFRLDFPGNFELGQLKSFACFRGLIRAIMTQSTRCLGHKEREDRRIKIIRLRERPAEPLDENYKVFVKKGPVSVETSLKEVEEAYESTPEWKMVKEGRVLSVPVEELRMENPPKPDRSGQVVFNEKRGGGGNQIERYLVVQTVSNLNEEMRVKHEEEKQKAKHSGKPEFEAEKEASAATAKLPQYQAVRAWKDRRAE